MEDDIPIGMKVVVDNSEQRAHPFARYIDTMPELIEAPEFIVDDVLIAGTAVVAGERGLGKTSALVPLVMACTGLLVDYPMKASIRRKVVYVAEDAAQVRRIIAAMADGGLINAPREEVNKWFKLVEAKRLYPHEIVTVIPHYDDLWTPNDKVDGTGYLAAPVMVLDTSNATINLDNISDNAEVSKAVATLRQGFGAISIVLIGHVTKASRSDAKLVSFIGAGSWEGDTQQALYLVMDEGDRYLVLGKRRFEPDAVEYRVKSYVSTFDAKDKLGRTVEIRCFYGIPEASTEESKEKAKAQRQAELKAATWTAVQNRVLEYVAKNEGASKNAIEHSVTGKAETIRKAIDELVLHGEIEVRDGDKGAQLHYPGKRTSRDDERGFHQ